MGRELLDHNKMIPRIQEYFPRKTEPMDMDIVFPEADEWVAISRAKRRLQSAALIAARVMVDILAILAAIWFSYWLRFESSLMLRAFPPEVIPGFPALAIPLLASIPLLVFYLKVFKMYDTNRYVRILDRLPRIVGAVNAYIITLLITYFLLKAMDMTRGYLLFLWFLSIAFIFLGRMLLQLGLSLARVNDVVVLNTLIVGAGKVGKSVAIKLKRHPKFGLRPVGFLDDDPLFQEFEEPELRDIKILGTHRDLSNIIREFEVDRVIIAFSHASHEQLIDLASKCKRAGVQCSVIPRLFEVITSDIVVNEIGGIPLIHLGEARIEGISRLLKTAEDYILGGLILLITWPILLATAVAIKLDSPGPVFFRHRRVGKDGKIFDCLKFRSMVNGADKMQAELVKKDRSNWLCWKKKEDPRITRVGRWIRKLSIDELPQIFNVLAGQMSLVGPRPHIPEEVKHYKEWHKQRLNVKPGITGLWQVNGRSDVPFDEMIKFDLYYIERWSPWLDFKIIMRTISAVLSRNGAY